MTSTSIVKAYDIRGTVPDELNSHVCELIARAVCILLRQEGESAIVVGHDMRESSPELVTVFTKTLVEFGINVTDLGLVSTDALYFASGYFELPGAMFTASHNPSNYNGLKLCRRNAVPIGQDSGLDLIKDYLYHPYDIERPTSRGTVTQEQILNIYADFFASKFSINSVQPLRVVVDAGNAMAGLTFPIVASRFNFDTHDLYFELDGRFPYHEPNPIDSQNLKDLQAKVLEVNADIGLAFDGDADRCFIVDENANIVSPSVITALISEEVLRQHPGATIVYNVISSRVVPETITRMGGIAIKSRVGHSFIKQLMAKHAAEFGGEHSGHFYFKEFWYADSGMFAALYVLQLLAQTSLPLSKLIEPYQSWTESGEINVKVADAHSALLSIKRYAKKVSDVDIDETDGLTLEGADWRVNIRMSNTEPLLRLNALARSHEEVTRLVNEYLHVINEVQLQL